jgi:hypothetical protein
VLIRLVVRAGLAACGKGRCRDLVFCVVGREKARKNDHVVIPTPAGQIHCCGLSIIATADFSSTKPYHTSLTERLRLSVFVRAKFTVKARFHIIWSFVSLQNVLELTKILSAQHVS